MSRRISDPPTSPPETLDQQTQTWHHPGGKLVDLGAHSLKQAELLAILIGSGVPGRPALAIANAILDEYVGLYGISRQVTVDDLNHIPGLGNRKAARILAAIELGRRLYRLNYPQKSTPEIQPGLFSSTQPPSQQEVPGEEPTDADLLAEIIGSGIRGRSSKVIAEDLLAHFGSFIDLFGQDMGNFEEIKGLNSVKIIRIAAALEISKRIAQALL